jgi:phage terminase large subunit
MLDLQNLNTTIRENPIWFSEEILKTPLWQKEREILLAIKNNKEVSVRSCNAAGKSYTAARVVHWWLLGNRDSIVITTAPTGRQVREVLWREIKDAVANKPIYPSNSILETKINIDNKWFALGISTDQPDQFQGFHSSNLLVIVDEASGVDDLIFEAIDGLKPAKILLIGNPLRNTGRFANSFKEARISKIQISAFDTPNLIASGFDSFEKFQELWSREGVAGFLNKNKIVIPGLITLDDVVKFAQRYGTESDVFRVRVLGEFPKAEAESFISIDEINSAMNRDVQVMPQWEKKMGVDIARYGDDRTVFVIRQMEKVLRKEVYVNQDLMIIAGYIIKVAKEENIMPENIFIDAIGMGAGVVDRLREQGWNVNAINTSLPADDREHYANLRAELAGYVKEWLQSGQLPKDDDFFEAANIKYKFTSKGQLQLESKEEMKKRGLPSPDVFDALALTFAYSSTNQTIYFPQSVGGVDPYYPDIGI